MRHPARWSAVAAAVALVVSSGLALPSASKVASDGGFVRALAVDGRTGPVVAIARAADTDGYWVVTSAGRVSGLGNAAELPSVHPNRWTGLVAAATSNPEQTGLVVATVHGRIYTLGAGPDYPAVHPSWHEGLVAAVVSAPGGRGVWVTTTHGRIFTLGTAPRLVSVHATWRSGAVTAAVAAPGGRGLWLITSNGYVLRTGRAAHLHSVHLPAGSGPVTAAVAAPSGRGLWLVTAHGRILGTGQAPSYPAVAVDRATGPVTAATDPPDGLWLATAEGMAVARPAGAPTPPSSAIATTTTSTTSTPTTSTSTTSTSTTSTSPTSTSTYYPAPPANTDPSPTSTVPVATTTTGPATTTTDPATTGPTVEVPASIPNDCSTDATAALNTLFAGLPAGATVVFPDKGCYLVSNTASSQLLLADTTGVTVEGNGSTFEQGTYAAGVCGTNAVQPVLQVEANTDLAIDDLTATGPGNCAGDTNEGDYGIMVGSWPVGNSGVTFTNVTIDNTDGDGLAVYPDLATDQGVNTDITFQDGTLDNIGYHGVTLEGVDGFDFTGNTVEHVGNFMDLEVDSGCTSAASCAAMLDANGKPVGSGEVDVSITHNVFRNGKGGQWIESTQACVPVANWTVAYNSLDTSTPTTSSFNGPCTGILQATSLYIIGNIGLYPNNSICSASIGNPPGCAFLDIQGWKHVVVTDNTFAANAGLPGQTLTLPHINLTAGSTTLSSSLPTFTNADWQDAVTGPGINPGTVVNAILSPTSVQLNQPATLTITNQTLNIGAGGYFPNTLWVPAISLCGDSGVSVTNNLLNNTYSATTTNYAECWLPYKTPTTDLTTCGNTYGLTAPFSYYSGQPPNLSLTQAPEPSPQNDGTCP